MTLTPGTCLGAYEILSALGAGGMGEVYRARDPKLHREVAIKVLPEAFAHDPGRLARFQREAHVLASLNHPHIAAIYGLEEPAGTTPAFLVMELVEGEDLSQRIERGAMPLDDALPIATQIAEALEAAHEQGIIHRDLKPANIKVRPDGTVKVLDFGLAKAMEPAGAMAAGASMAPTITTPAMTKAGMILGTAAYMSPEQAKGREADKRSDIWAFGAVLYEMLTARRAFQGEDTAETLAAVLRQEIDWRTLPASTPWAIRQLLKRCLERDAKQRLRDIGEARIVLDNPVALVSGGVSGAPGQASVSPWRMAVATVAGLGTGALLAGAGAWSLSRPPVPSVVRTTLSTSASTALAVQGADQDVAITPDGSRVVYRGNNQILVRTLDQLEPKVLTRLGSPRGVFISPDGQWVGYVNGTSLEKVAIGGGSPVRITSVPSSGWRGGTWGPNGIIVFAASASSEQGLQRVSSAGGKPTVLTRPDAARGEGDHVWPEFLPGGDVVLFTITPANGVIGNAQIAILDLKTGTWKVLMRGGSHARYVTTGHLVYGFAGTLYAVAFDLARLEVVGTPVRVVEGVVTSDATGVADAAVSSSGSLVYVSDTGGSGRRQVMLVDRGGRASALPGLPPGSYSDVRVSPDGARLALTLESDIWIYDFASTALDRLTTDPGLDGNPLWTPNGQRIVFTSRRKGYPELLWRLADGTGSDESFLDRGKDVFWLRANTWSPDGARLLFFESAAGGNSVIEQLAIDRPSNVRVLIRSDSQSHISPDGTWIAYNSSESGQAQVFVERYPQLGSRQRISTDGGSRPIWSRNGRELFFTSVNGRQMYAVAVGGGMTLAAGRPQALFEFPMLPPATGNRPYDVAADGRFVMVRGPGEGASTTSDLILIQNWFEELKRFVPAQ